MWNSSKCKEVILPLFNFLKSTGKLNPQEQNSHMLTKYKEDGSNVLRGTKN